MRFPNFLSFLLGAVAASAAGATGFNTPEEAILALEAAYSRKDLDGAVAAKDFREEARLMLQKIDPQLATDGEILRETAEVLELAFRKQIRETGFPDFKSLKCSFVSKKTLSPTLAKVTEECVSPRGEKTIQDLHVTRASGGWRVVVIAD
jgi:hypothetical protein